MKNSIIVPALVNQLVASPPRWLRLVAILCALCMCLPACTQAQSTGEPSFLHPPTKAPTPTLLPPKEIDLSQQLDAQGRAIAPLKIEAPDGCLHLEINQGIAVLNAAGQPGSRLVIQQDYPGQLPMIAYSVPISYAYRFGPDELRFSAPVKIIFSCLKNLDTTIISEISVGMMNDNGQWDQLSVQRDGETVWTRLESLQPGWKYILVGPAPMGS
ncbi:MAG TPA: hypothetical protein VF355_02410 [Anaerolineaceae bacterium]